MRLPAWTRRRLPLRRWVPYALLGLGSMLSIGAARVVASTAEAQSQATFQTNAQETRHQIQGGLSAYLEVVRAGTALIAASTEINHAEFRAFVTGLELRDRYPGIEGIGFSQRVFPRDLPSFLRAIHLDGVTPLRVWPGGERTEYHAIILLEPRDHRNQTALGFDMSTEPVRRLAMERARDTGQPAASGKLGHAQPFEEGARTDLVVYMPIYRLSAPIQTIEERRRALIGYVFSPLRLDDLLPRLVNVTTPSVAFEVYDGTVGDPATLFYRSTADTKASRFQLVEPVQIAGRDWLISVRSLEAPIDVLPEAAATLLAGLLLSILLFVITRVQVGACETAARHETEINALTQALRESELQLRRLVERERDARIQAQAVDRAKDEFLANLSHELRTPLDAILGWVTILRTASIGEEKRTHAIEVIERNARLQARLIEDLLDVSRIVTGKVELDLRPLAIAPIVSTVLETLRPTAEAKGVELRPLTSLETGRISGDTARVHEIAWNLLSNAIKFTPSGGHVSVKLTQDGDVVKLSVRDTGIGISPEFIPHVFERFRQADSSLTRAHGGVGLGLAIVRHLVELHRGSIDVQSDGQGRGALFTVRFPAMPASTESLPVVVVVDTLGRPHWTVYEISSSTTMLIHGHCCYTR